MFAPRSRISAFFSFISIFLTMKYNSQNPNLKKNNGAEKKVSKSSVAPFMDLMEKWLEIFDKITIIR